MDITSNFQIETGRAYRRYWLGMRRRSGTYPSLQLFAAVPAVYVLRLDLMSAAGANQMDDGFSLQIPESGLELVDLPHFFQQ